MTTRGAEIMTVEVHRPPDGLIGIGQAASPEKATRLAAWSSRAAERGQAVTLTASRSPYLLLMKRTGEVGERELLAVAYADSLVDHKGIEWHGLPPADVSQ